MMFVPNWKVFKLKNANKWEGVWIYRLFSYGPFTQDVIYCSKAARQNAKEWNRTVCNTMC